MSKQKTNIEIINKWITIDPKKIDKSANFLNIIQFYLFNCPVKNINHYSAVTVNEYGWDKGKLPKLKGDMLSDNNLKNRVFICNNLNDVELTILNNNLYGNQFTNEEFVVCWRNEKNIVEALLYLIRCAFAHRSFRVVKKNNEKYYYLANVDKGRIKGRAILKESTLLKWITNIQNGS